MTSSANTVRMSRSRKLVLIAIVIVAGMSVMPIFRGAVRYFALRRVFRHPEMRARLAIEPSTRTYPAAPSVHRINLGYATFDTGSTNPMSIGTIASGLAIILRNRDVELDFLPPYNPVKIGGQSYSNEARAHPHTFAFMRQMETNQVAAEMAAEQTGALPFSRMLFMNDDDFIVYTLKVTMKGGNRYGSKEVQFFETPYGKGIIRFGETTNDNTFAHVFLVAHDGTKGIGILFKMSDARTNNLSAYLSPVLGSFRFTESVDDQQRIKLLISEAGIQRVQPSAPSDTSKP